MSAGKGLKTEKGKDKGKGKGKDTGKLEKTRTIFDQKCPTCGTWMDTELEKDTITYSCSECGLTYKAVQ